MRLTGGLRLTPTSVDPFMRETETKLHGLNVREDTELTVEGLGRVRFKALVTNPTTGKTWLDVATGRRQVRSIAVDAVQTVHLKTKTREATK